MRSIMNTKKGVCYLCLKDGYYPYKNTELHHVFGGSNKGVCDEDGITVYLCRYHHDQCHNGKKSAEIRFELHQEGQKVWEDFYGLELIADGKKPREEFMKRYGRNYL